MKIKCSLACKINVPLKASAANSALYPRNSAQTIFCVVKAFPLLTKISFDCRKKLGKNGVLLHC